MALEFIGDAISLSGLTGSKVKCDIIRQYYPLWWNITSGGDVKNHEWPTAIVELDAATGEVFIEDTQTTILGSSGHTLELKCNNPYTKNLKIILVEKDPQCFIHLKNVINRRWKNVDIKMAEGPINKNNSNIYLLNKNLEDALNQIENIQLGNSLFFFDPLRSVEYSVIEKVAKKRITTYYRPGTEFIIFVFTSDWFLGRNDFSGLPSEVNSNIWSADENKSVLEADALFGDTNWRDQILTKDSIHEKEIKLVENYRERLHKWFRYVLPMPFSPKERQIFHLILCSNYEIGVRATRSFYSNIMNNPKYLPDNTSAFRYFKNQHPELFIGLSGAQRPAHWKILWDIISEHEEGVCDRLCRSFEKIVTDEGKRQRILDWLEEKGYLINKGNANVWRVQIPQYRLDWGSLKNKMNISPPKPFEPLSLRPLPLKDINE